MELTVYWTLFAEDKLEDVFSYLSEKAGERTARRIANEIVDKSLELEKNPCIGQKEINLANRFQEFRYLVIRNYKIIYWINREKARIEILNLFDCRQKNTKML